MGEIGIKPGDGPVLETLEPRLLLDGVHYIVNSLADVVADDGVVTFREAIEAADNNMAVTPDVLAGSGAETDVITFDQAALQAQAGAGNPLTITLDGAELEITEKLIIQGLGDDVLTIDADGRSRIFSIMGASTIVTLTGGSSTGTYSGGGISNRGVLTLTDITLSNNSSTTLTGGGGIWNMGLLTLESTILSGNSAHRGGGIYNTGTAILTNTTLYGNFADSSGGGMYNVSHRDLTAINTTLSGNYANDSGGGFFNAGRATLTNTTLSGNSAVVLGGGICDYNGALTLNNAIIALNDASDEPNVSGHLTTNSSLIAVDPGFVRNPSPGLDSIWGTDDDDYGDLRLGASSIAINLADNTLAVDALGDPLATDANGAPRIIHGQADIGAFEYQDPMHHLWGPPSTEVTTLADVADATDTETSLREAFIYGIILGRDVTFAASLSGGTITLNGSELFVYDSLTVDATSIGGITIDATGRSRVLYVSGDDTTAASLSGLTLTGGYRSDDGGGVRNRATLTLRNSTLSGNSAGDDGGGIYNYYGAVTLENTVLSDNVAGDEGGGIYNYSGDLTLTGTTLSRNSAGDYGGGIYNYHYSNLTLTNTTLSGNYGKMGGGIYTYYGVLTLTNTTLFGNAAQFYGGGIYNRYSTITLNNATLSGNSAKHTGAGIYNAHTLALNNTIVALNSGSKHVDILGSFASNASLIGEDPGFVRNPSFGPDGVWGGGDDDYGDLRLLATSIAVNAGDDALLPDDELDLDGDGDTAEPLPIDLDGNLRVAGGQVDIGAYELEPPFVATRRVFYNNSYYDGNSAAADSQDDGAIAADKSALLPGRPVGPANRTSYSKGINGVMIDVAGLTGTPQAGDFAFNIWDGNEPGAWISAPIPTDITLREGSGANNTDRVTLIWADGAVTNTWLKVTVKSDANGGSLGLTTNDVFYFGNSIGDCDGDGAVADGDYDALVSEFGSHGQIGELAADLTGDGRVDLADFVTMRSRFGQTAQIPTFPASAPEPVAQATYEPTAEAPAPLIPVVRAASDGVDLLAESLMRVNSIPEMRQTLVASPATPQSFAATTEYDLRPLSDDPNAANGDTDDLIPDILAESTLSIPL
jgi:hypothetical protein